jgi:hypothetical protein
MKIEQNLYRIWILFTGTYYNGLKKKQWLLIHYEKLSL